MLKLPAATSYQRMTFPRYRPSLEKPSSGTLAVAAHVGRDPVGLGLARIDSKLGVARLMSLYVVPARRRHGVAGGLVAALEDRLRRLGCRKLSAVYASGRPGTPALERLASRLGWTVPVPRSLIAKLSLADLLASAPRGPRSVVPPALSICSWKETTTEERLQIKRSQREKPWIPPELMPFNSELDAEPRTSLGLRRGAEVVGWLIAHEIDSTTLRVSCAWIHPDLQRVGNATPLRGLGTEAVTRASAAGYRYMIWLASFQHPRMVRFTAERMARYAVSLRETKYIEKLLQPE